MSIDTRTIISNAVGSVALFDALEPRQLMSAAGVSFHDNTLTVEGTSGSDQINVSWTKAGRSVRVDLNGHLSKAFDGRSIYTMQINAGDGNNRITVDSDFRPSTGITTGKGNDTISTGLANDGVYSGAGNDVVDTGAGNDIIYAGNGNDSISGGAGNDLLVGEAGNDVLNTGAGTDQVYAGSGTNKVIATASDFVDSGSGLGGSSVVTRVANDSSVVIPPTRAAASIGWLALVNADTGVAINGYDHLTDGITLDMAALPPRVTIVAGLPVGSPTESARFQFTDGSLDRVDTSSYLTATPKNSNGSITPWAPSSGSYTLNVTPYSLDEGKGVAGQTYTIHLNVKKTVAQGSGTITPTPVPTPVPTPTPTPSQSTDSGAPVIAVTALQGLSITAGQAFHVEATSTMIAGADIEDATFNWNFGDANGKYNEMPGFNAAHVYDRAGSYNVKLTVVAPNGKTSTSTLTVNVAAANTAKTLYVAANGNDSADGYGPGTALKTLARAVALAGDDTTILLRRGDTFAQNSTIEFKHNNVTVNTFGLGNSPVIYWTGARDRSDIFIVNTATSNVTIRGLTFDSIYNGDTEQTGMPIAIATGGTRVTVRDNTFLNIGVCVQANLNPHGLLVQDNSAPSDVGVRDYFCWVQGSDIVLVGNVVANSTREHNVRVGGATRVAIVDNKLTNLDRSSVDSHDNAKGTIACQKGSFAYIADNQLRGPAGIGPLGGSNGLLDKSARFTHAVFEDNTQFAGSFYLQHGAENINVRGNTLFDDSSIGFDVVGYNADYGRGVVNVTFEDNVVVNNGATGNFLVVEGAAQGLSLINNVYVAPYLAPGSFGTAAVFVNGADLSSFTRIDSNTWPSTTRANGYAHGSVDFVDTTYSSVGHKDPTQWNSLPQVGNDTFTDLTLDRARTITGTFALAA